MRTARICAAVNNSALNNAALRGAKVDSALYRSMADYLPSCQSKRIKHAERRAAIKPQSWGQMRASLGVE